MPSKDRNGRPLSGAAARRRAAEHRGQRSRLAQIAPELAARLPEFHDVAPPPPAAPLATPAPPYAAGVAAGITWAATVQAQAAGLARRAQDPERVRAVACVVRALGQLRHHAADAERLARAWQAYRGVAWTYQEEEPPAQPALLCAWAFWRLAELLHQVATAPLLDDLAEKEARAAARSYGLLGVVQPQAEIDRLTLELEQTAGGS